MACLSRLSRIPAPRTDQIGFDLPTYSRNGLPYAGPTRWTRRCIDEMDAPTSAISANEESV